MSPRWKAGSMLPLSTTTTGLSDSVITIRLFQIMSAEHTIIARLSTWCASWRLRMSRSVWYISTKVSMVAAVFAAAAERPAAGSAAAAAARRRLWRVRAARR